MLEISMFRSLYFTIVTFKVNKVMVHHSDDDIFKLEILRSPTKYQWFEPLQECKILYCPIHAMIVNLFLKIKIHRLKSASVLTLYFICLTNCWNVKNVRGGWL